MASHPRKNPVAVSADGSSTEASVSRVDIEDRRDGPDPNHHLWRNGRLWWIAFTVHRGHLQERVRFSLRTDDVGWARRRRDNVFALYASAADCKISIRLRQPAPAKSAHSRSSGHHSRRASSHGAEAR